MKQATVAAVTGVLMFAGVAPAAAAPEAVITVTGNFAASSSEHGSTMTIVVEIKNLSDETVPLSQVAISSVDGLKPTEFDVICNGGAEADLIRNGALAASTGVLSFDVVDFAPTEYCVVYIITDVVGSKTASFGPGNVTGTAISNKVTASTMTIRPIAFDTVATGFTQTMVTPDHVSVTWDPPASTGGNGVVVSYEIGVWQNDGEHPASWDNITPASLPLVFNVIQGESYSIVVTAMTSEVASTETALFTAEIPVNFIDYNAIVSEAVAKVDDVNYSAYHRALLAEALVDPVQNDFGYDSITRNTAKLRGLVRDLIDLKPLKTVIAEAKTLDPLEYDSSDRHRIMSWLSSAEEFLALAVDPAEQVTAGEAIFYFEGMTLTVADVTPISEMLVTLSDLAATGDALEDGDFTAYSAGELDAALTSAKTLIDEAAPDADAVAYAIIWLQGAIDELVDLSGLRATYAAATKSGDYAPFGWSFHRTNLTFALDILTAAADTGYITEQAVVDNAASMLAGSEDTIVDLSVLRAAYESAMTVDSDAYLSHGWPAFATARDSAQTAMNFIFTGKTQVASALLALTDARQALVHNNGLHDVIVDSRLKDESRYGTATWARYEAAVDALKSIAARDLAGEFIPGSEMSAAMNEYYVAQSQLLDLPSLFAALDDFDELEATHYADVAFGELAAIAAGIDRVIADAGDPAKVAAPGDGFLLPRYWAKKAELTDIRALTAAFQRVDVINHSKHAAHGVRELRNARLAAKEAVETQMVNDLEVAEMINQLGWLENDLADITPLEDSLAAAAALTERGFMSDSWSQLAYWVAEGQTVLSNAADPDVPIVEGHIGFASNNIRYMIEDMVIRPVHNPQTVDGLSYFIGGLETGGKPLGLPTLTDQGGAIKYSTTGSASIRDGFLYADRAGEFTVTWTAAPIGTDWDAMSETTAGTFAATPADPPATPVDPSATPASSGPSMMPRTGADLSPLFAGLLLTAAGVLMVSRRRWAKV